ncbi:hypothetical protein FNH22_11290 [Fulvivirga sp. M361]|uniref:hypothetical protein n=1 Tax=Fulvivirga sp. M361 TaxID=2594266 RepID=UPI00117B1FC8|nr:hypothetical protein [Fulvivirga sp. M361]TRX59100.1 hypothetical protein FNH22_11290 [Fulvivirga sp. M361]
MRTIVLAIFLFLTLSVSLPLSAQDIHKSSQKGEASLGLGLGLQYGSIGARLGLNLADHFNVFGGLGYMIAGVGYNIGLQYSLPSTKQTEFYFTGMVGTNAAIKVEGLSEYDEVYIGPSFGLGVKVNSLKREGNFWDFGLLVPITSTSFKDQQDAIKNDPRIAEFTEAWPVLIVVGYNFNL